MFEKIISILKLNKKERELLEELKGYELTDYVYDIYRNKVKNNKDNTYEITKKKLIRNIIIGKEAPLDRKNINKRTFYYGNLIIQINTEEKLICWINNSRGRYDLEIDEKKKKWLERILGI